MDKPLHKHDRHSHDRGSHDHHGHHHVHGAGAATGNIKVALLLNLGFAIIEAVGGWLTGSIAIMTDALHDFGDSLALGFALVMERLAGRLSNAQFSYGYRRLSLLSALFTAVFLIVGSAVMLAHAVPRLLNPVQPHAGGMLALSLLGIAVNGYAAWRLHKGSTMNERVVSWHMLEDLLGWVVIFVSSIVMMFVSIPILDPVLSIIFVVFIMIGTVRSLRETLHLFLQGVPRTFDIAQLKADILGVPRVKSVHDLHFWSLDGSNHVLTAHIVVHRETLAPEMESVKQEIRSVVARRGRIHVTLEIEPDGGDCPAIDCVDDGRS